MVFIGDLLLLLALFMSAFMALSWGELGSYPIHGDKSGLAGLGAVFLFMVGRWVTLALALAVATLRGGFPELAGGRGTALAIVLGMHTALGIVSYRGLEWINAAIQRSDGGPQRAAWVFAFLVPLPAIAAAIWGLNRGWIPRHRVLAVLLVGLIVWSHVAAWRQGYRRG